MYLKTDKIVVTIKNTVFRSSRVGPAGQYILDPTAMLGWTDGTAARRDNTTRPVSSGDFTEPYTFSSRLITLSGSAVAKSSVDLHIMRDKLVGLFQEGEYVEMSVETISGIRYATIGLEGAPAWTQQNDNVAVWKLDLYAPDPFIYGVERTINLGATTAAGGGLKYILQYPLNYNALNTDLQDFTVTNRGNAKAWPKFKVTGDYYSGFVLTDGRDKKITYNAMVSRNSPVIIDTGKGTATQGGVDRTVHLSDREWFSISPGEIIRPQFLPIQAASGYCDIIIRDTFI